MNGEVAVETATVTAGYGVEWLIVAVGLVTVVLFVTWLGRARPDCGRPACSQRRNPYHSHM